jgi:hypothetical protein
MRQMRGGIMTLDRYGEPIEDDEALVALSDALLDFEAGYVPRSPDEIRAHCAELRAVLAEARERREVQP